MQTDSVDAIFNFTDKRVCVLNFASYKNPGGMFMNGSKAQEECLCHESFLYNVLSSFDRFYKQNKDNLNKALYTNRAIYSPKIKFGHKGKTMFADVLTCASPNKYTAQKMCKVTDEENIKALRDRIRFILYILYNKREKLDCVILGAFGCGVFGQSPQEVASIFREEINNIFLDWTKTDFIFAVINSENSNYEDFKKALL